MKVCGGYKIDLGTLDMILSNGLTEEETVAVSDFYPFCVEFWIDKDKM
ncbi:hypothetical protein KA005_32330 [bacterium]|nr:hypothetical protein [bacterium]